MESNNKTKQDLSLVATDELLNELYRRHDAVIFAGKLHRNSIQYTITRKFYGNRDVCLAMCSNLSSIINDAENKCLGPIIE